MADNLIDKSGKLNQEAYNKQVENQKDAFAKIDSVMAVLEKLPYMVDSDSITLGYSTNPMGFLFKLLSKLGVPEEKLREWITEFLIYTLPEVEIGFKAILLANIKAIISCNSDPRIPWFLRKKVGDSIYADLLAPGSAAAERGFDISISMIDPMGSLDLSPFTEPGNSYYFGCSQDVDEDSNSKIAALARADDFNAFLWYVIHKGNKQNPIIREQNDLNGFTELSIDELGDDYPVGATFCNSDNPTEIYIFLKREGDMCYLVPLSSDWRSCNWYVDKTNYYNKNLGIKEEQTPRNYAVEKAICNLMYAERRDYKGNLVGGSTDNIRFTILPKPAVIIPSVDYIKQEGENNTTTVKDVKVNWRIIRLLFEADGTPSQKGKYSLPAEKAPTKNAGDKENVYTFNLDGGNSVNVVVDRKSGKYWLENEDDASKLIECYPGLTVYEFNYDYIMGMKLFDPKVICEKLFRNSANNKYNAFFSLSFNKLKNKGAYPLISGRQRVIDLVKKIIETDDEEINDCFYSFSNEEYEELLKKTEQIMYNQSPYTEGYGEGQTIDFASIENLLADYPQNGTLEEQKYVISKALEEACAVIDNNVLPEYRSKSSSIKINFLTNILEQLVACIVDAILSPKILMLLEVNRQLMSDEGEPELNTELLLKLMKNVITALIKELRDLILQKILSFIMEFLTQMQAELMVLIQSEQMQAYMAIMKLLMAYVGKGIQVAGRLSAIYDMLNSRLKNWDYGDDNFEIPTVLDNVFYADIYDMGKKDKAPIINNC